VARPCATGSFTVERSCSPTVSHAQNLPNGELPLLSPPTRRSPPRAADQPLRPAPRAPTNDGAPHGALRGLPNGAHGGSPFGLRRGELPNVADSSTYEEQGRSSPNSTNDLPARFSDRGRCYERRVTDPVAADVGGLSAFSVRYGSSCRSLLPSTRSTGIRNQASR
jgi:hypothetical protein